MIPTGDILFSEILKLYIKSPDDQERVVRLTVELIPGSMPVGEKTVYVKVTDEEDPFFFYGLMVNQDEFMSIKTHQNLLIEFNKFPEQLVQLLKQCCTNTESPKYLLLLEQFSSNSVLPNQQMYLKFVEKNKFKQLCHLALKVGDPSTDELQEYMASKIKSLKDAASKNVKKISILEAELAKVKSDLATACSVQDESYKKWADEKTALEIAHVREITAERERLADAKLLWQKEEEQRKAKEQRNVSDRLKKLELELSNVRAQYDETRDKLSVAKEQNIKLIEELSTKTSELEGLRRDLPCLKKQNIILDTDYHEKQKQLDIVRTDNTQLKEELKEKTAEAACYLREIESLKEAKAELKKIIDSKTKDCTVLKEQNEELRQDIVKANSIICTIQSEFDDVHHELLIKKTMVAQQEKIIAKKEKNLKHFSSELKFMMDTIKMLEFCREDLSQKLNSAAAQLTVKDRELATNRNVIRWLNRKLTESQVTSPAGPVSASTPYQGFSGDSALRPFTTSGQSVPNPCWQSLRPRWWSDSSTAAQFPSGNVRGTSPEPVVPTAAQGERTVQNEAISESGGPQETEKKTASQLECQTVDAPSPRKKPIEPIGFSRGTSKTKFVKPGNTPSSYFPGAV